LQGLFWFKRNEKKVAKAFKLQNALLCQILVLRDYRFQFDIKILSEGVMMTNFISKYSPFLDYLYVKKSRGSFLFKRNEKKIAKTLNTQNAFRCQILVLRGYRFQFNIKILSEGVMMTNFI